MKLVTRHYFKYLVFWNCAVGTKPGSSHNWQQAHCEYCLYTQACCPRSNIILPHPPTKSKDIRICSSLVFLNMYKFIWFWLHKTSVFSLFVQFKLVYLSWTCCPETKFDTRRRMSRVMSPIRELRTSWIEQCDLNGRNREWTTGKGSCDPEHTIS